MHEGDTLDGVNVRNGHAVRGRSLIIESSLI